MLPWSIAFFLIALGAGVFGFAFVAGTAALLAKVAFFVFLVLFVVSFVISRRHL